MHQTITIMAKTPFSLKLEPELLEEVRLQAKQEHRSVSNLIEIAIIKYLEEIKQQKTPTE